MDVMKLWETISDVNDMYYGIEEEKHKISIDDIDDLEDGVCIHGWSVLKED